MLKLAIIGRPNVGKSTLFNRIAGKKLAIVDDTPGITRDWREAGGYLFDQPIHIIDTAGLEDAFDESIEGRMRRQTEEALNRADAALFMIDGRAGLTPLDRHFAQWLRKQKIPVILGINKGENERAIQSTLAEAYGLGLGDPVILSAEHGVGMEELYGALQPYFKNDEENADSAENEGDGKLVDDETLDAIEGDEEFEFIDEEEEEEKALKVAIVGKPNVGKSTLLNALVGGPRSMTGPEAGITRDAVSVHWDYKDREFRLVDTAGLRKKAKITNKIEKMSTDDSLRAIRLAQVVILVLDANNMLEKQDLSIADHVINEGRALVIAVNKWDSVGEKREQLQKLSDRLERSLAQIRDIPVITISALNGKNINRLMDTVLFSYDIWDKRVSTGHLNRWLKAMESHNPAPLVGGRSNRLRYIAQIKTRPPTFALWVSRPKEVPAAYKRYLINGLREDFDIKGVPIRLLIRTSKNPFKDGK